MLLLTTDHYLPPYRKHHKFSQRIHRLVTRKLLLFFLNHPPYLKHQRKKLKNPWTNLWSPRRDFDSRVIYTPASLCYWFLQAKRLKKKIPSIVILPWQDQVSNKTSCLYDKTFDFYITILILYQNFRSPSKPSCIFHHINCVRVELQCITINISPKTAIKYRAMLNSVLSCAENNLPNSTNN